MGEHVDTVVIGGGQAGLAMSAVLTRHGREHVVLERGHVGERWRTERWDSLRFQFPNWSLELPGYAYSGDDPDGFADSAEIGRIITDYAKTTNAPVRDETEVIALDERDDRHGFVVTTSGGVLEAQRVVLATGPFHRPLIPDLARGIPSSVYQTDPTRYRNPAELPAGAVLVVGSGASGSQIADELHHAGRRVYLSVSSHRRAPRRFAGKDLYWWLERANRFAQTADSLPSGEWPPGLLVTGVNGGYDLDIRRLAAAGVEVVGRVIGAAGGGVAFDASVNDVLNASDQAYAGFMTLVRGLAKTHLGDDLQASDEEIVGPVTDIEFVDSIDLDRQNVGTVIWATGYTYDYHWVRVPVFDARGRPLQRRGVTDRPGLYFLGLHWMHTFKSGLFSGVGTDAEYLAEHMSRAL